MARKRISIAGLMVLLLAPAFPATPAQAHHDWSAYDTTRTVYLSGFVGEVRWQNPHPKVQLEVPPGLGVPEDLADADISGNLEQIGGRQSLGRATVPDDAAGSWTIELESPSFMEARGMDGPPVVGEPMRIVGFLSRQEPRVLRVELVVLEGGRVISVRESAVATLPTGVSSTENAGAGNENNIESSDPPESMSGGSGFRRRGCPWFGQYSGT